MKALLYRKVRKILRPLIYVFVLMLHIGAVIYIKINVTEITEDEIENTLLIKLVDVVEVEPEIEIPETIEVFSQPKSSETIIEVEEEVEESILEDTEPDFIQQHLISEIPIIPTNLILDQIEYPVMAQRQGIEAVVYLELYIDKTGKIRRVEVLRDPGHGFAEAAVKALENINCSPALSNGAPVAVRFRYPIRFVLQ